MEYVDAFNEQERLIIGGFIDLMAETPYEKITVKEIGAYRALSPRRACALPTSHVNRQRTCKQRTHR